MRKLVAVLVLAVSLAACSKSSSDADKTTTTTTIPVLSPAEIDVAASPYCAQWAEVRKIAGDSIVDLDSAAKKAHYATLVPVVEKLKTAAPAEIAGPVDVALQATREAARLGSVDPFNTDDATAAQEKLQRYAYDHCRKKA